MEFDILLVEDNEGIRKACAGMIRACVEETRVSEAGTLDAAIREIDARNFDMVIADPHIDVAFGGFRALERAKFGNPACELVLLSGFRRVDIDRALSLMPEVSFVQKGEDSTVILDLVIAKMARKRGISELPDAERARRDAAALDEGLRAIVRKKPKHLEPGTIGTLFQGAQRLKAGLENADRRTQNVLMEYARIAKERVLWQFRP